MLRTRIICFLIALAGAFAITQVISAAETDCDSVYCFSQEDFSKEEITGICVTSVPAQRLGSVMLGSREVRPGDILTAEQVSLMTFQPALTEVNTTATVEYLPVFADRVAPSASLTIEIRGKENLPPAAQDMAMETYKNLPLDGKLKVKDPEGQAMTYAVIRQPRRGMVELNPDGSFTYTPKKNKIGTDSFVFTATDAAGKTSRQATVTVTIIKPTSSTLYTDTVGTDCRFAAEWMKNTGIFTGEDVAGNACFGPEKQVSRGEFITMLVKTLDIPTQDALAQAGLPENVPGWLRPYLAAAVRAGLTAGLPTDGPLCYTDSISSAEAAVLLQNALDLQMINADPRQQEVPAWAEDAVEILQSHDFELVPTQLLTRGDAAKLLHRAASMAETAPGLRVLRTA